MQNEIQNMFDNVVHVGHRTRKWNPLMKKYLYGEMNGIHIINLEKTYELLEKALAFLSKLKLEGKKVMFVSTKPQSSNLIAKVSGDLSMPYVVSRWIPGLLTNYSTIKTRIKYLADLKDQEATGEFEKYTKKEAAKLKKVIDKLQNALGGVSGLTAVPDAVFVVDVVRDKVAVEEARRLGIPVIAFVDSNADPSVIDYPIPANDDALRSVTYLMSRISDALGKSSNSK